MRTLASHCQMSLVATYLLVAIFLAAACAPGSRPHSESAAVRQNVQAASDYGMRGSADGEGQLPATDPAPRDSQPRDKTLVIGIGAEVRGFSTINGLQNKYVEDLLVGNLFLQDDQGRWFPALAAELPNFEDGTWKLNDDRTSETIYKLRRGVKWHDGVEFTVHDLVLCWKVATDRDVPYEGRSQPSRAKKMEPLDDYTVKVTWDRWEPEAGALELRWFWPMPRHILEEVYTSDKQRFINHPYWTTGFVGLGPYKLVRFVQGSHLELTANEDYILGAPKIRNVIVKFYSDPNVLVSDLLAGNVHTTLHGQIGEGALSMSDGILLANRWGATREGKVIFHPKSIALISVQLNRESQRPAALGDLRARQALLHGIDRQALIDKLFSGFTDVAHGWLSPHDPDHPVMAEAITRYDHDLSRAQRLLGDVGWQKASDGMLRNAAGERFELEYRAVGRDYQNAATIVADQWKRLGVDAKLVFVPEAGANDNEWMAKTPGVRAHYMVSAPVGGAVTRYLCDRVATAENQWLTQDTNPAGYCNQEMERHNRAFNQAFPFSARLEPFKEMMRLALHDLPYLPLYFEMQPVAVRASVSGINAVPPQNNGRIGMHSYTWDLR